MSTVSPKRVKQNKQKSHRVPAELAAIRNADSSVAKASSDKPAPVWAPWLPDRLRWDNVDWVVVGWMSAMHIGALAAPFFFTWQALATCFVLHWFTASIGICLGYHRFLSHKSFKLQSPARLMAIFAGVLSGEGSPIVWAATHRLHHQRSDQEGDPHSPLITAVWSHLSWLFIRRTEEERQALFRKYTPDLIVDPMLQFFEKTYFMWLVASGVALYTIGAVSGVGGLSMLLWGLCMRMVLVYHGTWFVNSATHLWGYRNYDARDESRNLWWVAIWAYGEGWHNNHHAHPHVAPAGHRWWELDPTWWAIKTLRLFGLAYDVDDRIPTTREPAPEA